MNRVAWLVLASCAAAPQHRDPPIRSAPVPAPPAPATTTEARLAIAGGALLDIVIDGVDATTHRQCTWLVEHPGPGIPPDARVDRACAVGPLPPLPLRSALLVTEEILDANTTAVDELTAGGPIGKPRDFLTNLHGKRVSYQPMDDLATCERVRRQIAADLARQEADVEASEKARIDHELAQVIAEETDICRQADEGEATCVLKNGRAASTCEDGKLHRIECKDKKRRHEELDMQRNAKPTPRSETQRCEPPTS